MHMPLLEDSYGSFWSKQKVDSIRGFYRRGVRHLIYYRRKVEPRFSRYWRRRIAGNVAASFGYNLECLSVSVIANSEAKLQVDVGIWQRLRRWEGRAHRRKQTSSLARCCSRASLACLDMS